MVLDGGGSTTLVIDGESVIVDANGERRSAMRFRYSTDSRGSPAAT